MKNVSIYLISILFLGIIACEDSTSEKAPAGTWNYESAYLQFEYSQDTVQLNMGPMGNIKASVEDINKKFPAIADNYMGKYFKGIDFVNASELRINMQMGDGSAESLKASYKIKGDLIEITLDTDDLKRLTGMSLEIPAISFKWSYPYDDNTLALYFTQEYATICLHSMLPKMLPMLGLPPMAQAALTAQIEEILGGTRKLDLGVWLKQVK